MLGGKTIRKGQTVDGVHYFATNLNYRILNICIVTAFCDIKCAEEAKQLRDQLLELCEIEEGNTILRLKGSAPADENIRRKLMTEGVFAY